MERKTDNRFMIGSVTRDSQSRTRADSSSDEDSPLLTSFRRGSAPAPSTPDRQAEPSTPPPQNSTRIERFTSSPAPAAEDLRYDATAETTLRFAQARLVSPSSSSSGITCIPYIPRIKVSGIGDPFIDSPHTSSSYISLTPRTIKKPNSDAQQDSSQMERKSNDEKRKPLSTAEIRAKIVADSEERKRCMRKVL